jgi:hypothetical protein
LKRPAKIDESPLKQADEPLYELSEINGVMVGARQVGRRLVLLREDHADLPRPYNKAIPNYFFNLHEAVFTYRSRGLPALGGLELIDQGGKSLNLWPRRL